MQAMWANLQFCNLIDEYAPVVQGCGGLVDL